MSSKLPIVCWGCGEYGDIFVDYMEKYGYDEYFSIEYFLDKCPTKKFRSYKCFPIYEEFVKGKIVLITNVRYKTEIVNQCISWGLTENETVFTLASISRLFSLYERTIGYKSPVLKLSFDNFGDIPQEIFLYALMKRYRIVIDNKNPDVSISSVFGNKIISPDVIRILYTGENIRPNLTDYDYNIGFDHCTDERYLRWPLYFLYHHSYIRALSEYRRFDIDSFMQRSFASRVVSKDKAHFREEFFEALNKRRYVASGGKLKNNLSGLLPVKDKNGFIKKYKFNLAFENASYPGYATEKIIQAFAAGCIPVYWGDPSIDEQFNNKTFINVRSEDSVEQIIEKIIYISERSEEIEKMFIQAPVINTVKPLKQLSEFLYKSITCGGKARL